MQRYLLLTWDPNDAEGSRLAAATEAALQSASPPWKTGHRNSGVLFSYEPRQNGSTSIYALGLRGAVLGTLFRRTAQPDTYKIRTDLCDAEVERIVRTEGRYLVEHFWGSYVAILHDTTPGSVAIFRDPTANLACYHAKWNTIDVFFSDMEDFRRYIPMQLYVRWSYIAARLLGGNQLSRDCALNDIEDIPGGELVRISKGSESRDVLWHPARFCVEDSLESEETALNELRQTVRNVVHALASEHSDVLMRLSGGLDSSIVTSCLAQAPQKPQITCLNLYISSSDSSSSSGPLPTGFSDEVAARIRRNIGSADERQFARRVADKFGLNLVEREKRIGDIDFRRIWDAPLSPRPSGYIFALDNDQLETECASDCRATACFGGEAGDTVFYNTHRAISALDYAYLHPLGPDLLRHIADTSALSGESPARVFGKVIKHGFLRIQPPLSFEPMKEPHLLRDDVANALRKDYFCHPWDALTQRLCPGKRNHVLGITSSTLTYHHVYRRERVARSVYPLASQPVVETCLRIPTYVLLKGGVSRGLARSAFRDQLPQEIVRRTAKGGSLSFCQRLVRQNVDFIRERLLDGLLVRKGLLDRTKLEGYLTRDQPFLSVLPHQIMDYLACEAWLSQCSE